MRLWILALLGLIVVAATTNAEERVKRADITVDIKLADADADAQAEADAEEEEEDDTDSESGSDDEDDEEDDEDDEDDDSERDRPRIEDHPKYSKYQEFLESGKGSGSGNGWGFGAGGACFSKDQTVATPQGPRAMEDLRTGDLVEVMTPQGLTYQPVLFFTHQVQNEAFPYLVVTTENGNQLTVTDRHLLYLNKGSACRSPVTTKLDPLKFKFAARVMEQENLNWCLAVRRPDGALVYDRVADVQRTLAEGLYAPMTESGTLMVNGVLASCYTNVENQHFAHNVYLWSESLIGTENVEDGEPRAEGDWKASESLRLLHNLGQNVLANVAP